MGKGLFRDMAIEWAEIISREIAVTRLRTIKGHCNSGLEIISREIALTRLRTITGHCNSVPEGISREIAVTRLRDYMTEKWNITWTVHGQNDS